jgi:hypothetical protein
MNAASPNTVASLERLGLVLPAALVPLFSFLVFGGPIDVASSTVASWDARDCFELANPVRGPLPVVSKTWLQPRIMHPSARRCLHVLVPVKR